MLPLLLEHAPSPSPAAAPALHGGVCGDDGCRGQGPIQEALPAQGRGAGGGLGPGFPPAPGSGSVSTMGL